MSGFAMDHLLTRRVAVSALALACSATYGSGPERPCRDWLLGEWLSDRERTMENFYLRRKSLSDAQRNRISTLFGNMKYRITRRHFRVGSAAGEMNLKAAYVVLGETGSSITLGFPRNKDMPDLTLYRVSSDMLFVRAGYNLEYFRRTAT